LNQLFYRQDLYDQAAIREESSTLRPSETFFFGVAVGLILLGTTSWIQLLIPTPIGFLGYAAPYSNACRSPTISGTAPPSGGEWTAKHQAFLVAERLVASAEITNCLYTFIGFCQYIT